MVTHIKCVSLIIILPRLYIAAVCFVGAEIPIVESTQISCQSQCFTKGLDLIYRCVEEYNKDTKLDHVPDILSGRSEDDRIHQSYHEIVMSDSDIDKLVSLPLIALNLTSLSRLILVFFA